jgi:hypothetical protein
MVYDAFKIYFSDSYIQLPPFLTYFCQFATLFFEQIQKFIYNTFLIIWLLQITLIQSIKLEDVDIFSKEPN